MKAETVIKKAELQRKEGEKALLLRGLNALLLTTPTSRKTTRSYIEKAITYIEEN